MTRKREKFIVRFLERLSEFLIAAFAFLAAEAWAPALDELTSVHGHKINKWVYALALTGIAVLITFGIERVTEGMRDNLDDEENKK